MKKTLVLLFVLAVGTALATKGYSLQGSAVDIEDCATGGDTATTLSAGVWSFRVLREDTYVCFVQPSTSSNTCASGGYEYPVGTVMPLEFGSATSVNCRSAGGLGDVRFTKVR